MDLKNQTREFAKFLRNRAIGSPKYASKLVIKKYESLHGAITADVLVNNFSEVLSSILVNQKTLFKAAIKDEVEGNWINNLNDLDDGLEFKIPDYIKASDQLTEILQSDTPILKKKSNIIELLAPLQSSLSVSNSQSAKARAGNAFEYHLENFFDILELKFDVQKKIEGEKFDFIFPDLNRFIDFPNDCLLCEAQTTLKDRFRLTEGKALNIQTNKYLFSASGCGVITDKDYDDFSREKLNELQAKGVTLVVLREARERINHPILKSFEEFINIEYPTQELRWEI